MFRYGQTVTLVANPRNRPGAAFRRLKDGVLARYKVTWVNRDGTMCDAKYINDKGKLTTAYWTFRGDEVVPSELLGKKLEDYL